MKWRCPLCHHHARHRKIVSWRGKQKITEYECYECPGGVCRKP